MIDNELYCPFSRANCRIDCALIAESSPEEPNARNGEYYRKNYFCSLSSNARKNVPNVELSSCFYKDVRQDEEHFQYVFEERF